MVTRSFGNYPILVQSNTKGLKNTLLLNLEIHIHSESLSFSPLSFLRCLKMFLYPISPSSWSEEEQFQIMKADAVGDSELPAGISAVNSNG